MWSTSVPESLTSLAVEPLLTRDYDSRPAFVFERLRHRYGPVAPVDLLGVPVWLVLGYPEALEVLRDGRGIWKKHPDHWRARSEGRVPQDWPLLPIVELDCTSMQDGQRLAELRAAWSAALQPYQDRTQRPARDLEAVVGDYADELISLFAESGGRAGHADLIVQYTRPLPLMVFNHLLGLENAQTDDILMDMWRMVDAGPDAAEATGRLLRAFAEMGAAKITRPGDDFVSRMIAARPVFTADELARELVMVIGILDLTGTLISNAVTEVITGNAGVRASLSAGLTRETINQVAMINPPLANLSFRFPALDVKLGDYTLAAGDAVVVSIAGAHADPALSGGGTNPDAVLSSRAHLAWGAGPHHCLGAQLAGTISEIAVNRLFDRLASLRLALPGDQLPWRPSPMFRALRSLPVQFELSQEFVPKPKPATPSHTPGDQTTAAAAEDGPYRSVVQRFLRALRRAQ